MLCWKACQLSEQFCRVEKRSVSLKKKHYRETLLQFLSGKLSKCAITHVYFRTWDSDLAYKLLISPSTLGLMAAVLQENAFVSCFSIIFLVVSLGIKTVCLCSNLFNTVEQTSKHTSSCDKMKHWKHWCDRWVWDRKLNAGEFPLCRCNKWTGKGTFLLKAHSPNHIHTHTCMHALTFQQMHWWQLD